MVGSSKHAVEGLISDPSRISVAIRNDRTVTGHLLNELRTRADPEAALALKETYLAILDVVLDGPKQSYHKWKGKSCPGAENWDGNVSGNQLNLLTFFHTKIQCLVMPSIRLKSYSLGRTTVIHVF